ncbi:MAG: cytochrome c3 family protein [Acidobacteria bacterium]|nr:cytochrome c3 family protein [Acidobacteriota bacterium]
MHKDLDCVACHTGLNPDEVPHGRRIEAVNCLNCHEDAPAAHRFHAAMAAATGNDGGPGVSCKECHGTHEVASPTSSGAKYHSSRLASSCGECHEPVARQYLESEHGRAFSAGVQGAPGCLTCHRHPITDARTAGEPVERKVAQEKICLSCHLDNPEVRARMGPEAGFIAGYEKSVYGNALLMGNAAAVNCVDCHGSHEMKKGFEPTARVNRRQIPETCGACHTAIALEFERSVHGTAARRGIAEEPVCTDCHGEHNILSPDDSRSPVAPANVSAQVCSPCHSSLRLSEKYGLASDRFRTFADSYHGLAIREGSLEVASCASCHGAHGTLPSSDPASRVHKSNLASTCGACHPGASARFGAGRVHVLLADAQEPVLYWIATAYLAVIVVVVGDMFLHNLLDFVRKAHGHLQARSEGAVEEPAGRALYLRMTLGERLQHGALVLSFTLLVVTGFML